MIKEGESYKWPWFCLSSMPLPSNRCFEFTDEPSGRLRCKGFGCNNAYLAVVALGTFEQPVFKPIGPCETRSSIIRVWQREQRWRSIVATNCWGEAKTRPCVVRERYRTLCHRWVPMATSQAPQ